MTVRDVIDGPGPAERAFSWADHHLFPAASALVALLAYLLIAWVILPPGAIWSPDEGAKWLQLQSLRLSDGRLVYAIPYPGRELDPDLRFAQPDAEGLLRVRDGQLFFQRLPLFTLLVLPLFHWFGVYGLYIVPVIGGAASGALMLLLLEPCDRRLSMWLLAAFCSPLLIYATTFWEHTLATSLSLLAASIAARLSAPGSRTTTRQAGWLVVGLLLGLSAYLRLELIIFGLALLVACWLLMPGERWLPCLAGALLGVVMLPYVPLHHLMFGQPVADNALYLFYPFFYLRTAGWRVVSDVLIGPWIDDVVNPGLVGSIWAWAALGVVGLGFAAQRNRLAYAAWLGGLAISTIAAAIFLFSAATYRSVHGLLLTAPWALIGLSRAQEVWRRGDRRARIVVLTVLLGLAGYLIGLVGLRASSPHGGLEWGARFALTFYPLLALLAAWDYGPYRRTIATAALIWALMLIGLGLQARGIWTIYGEKQLNVALYQALLDAPEPYVVTDLWWMPLNAAPLSNHKTIFVTATPERFHEWLQRAQAHQVRQFCFVTLDGSALQHAAYPGNPNQLAVAEARQVGALTVMRVAIRS